MEDNLSFDAKQRINIGWRIAMPKVQHVVLTANIESFVHESLVETKKILFSITQKFVCDRISGAI